MVRPTGTVSTGAVLGLVLLAGCSSSTPSANEASVAPSTTQPAASSTQTPENLPSDAASPPVASQGASTPPMGNATPASAGDKPQQATIVGLGRASLRHYSVEILPISDTERPIEGLAAIELKLCATDRPFDASAFTFGYDAQPKDARPLAKGAGGHEPVFEQQGTIAAHSCRIGWFNWRDPNFGKVEDGVSLLFRTTSGDQVTWNLH